MRPAERAGPTVKIATAVPVIDGDCELPCVCIDRHSVGRAIRETAAGPTRVLLLQRAEGRTRRAALVAGQRTSGPGGTRQRLRDARSSARRLDKGLQKTQASPPRMGS